jgi:hypothetical protein
MKFLGILVAVSLVACTASPPLARLVESPAAAPVQPTLKPMLPLVPPRVTDVEIRGIHFTGLSFDSRSHRLVVVDQTQGPGSVYADSASAGRAHGGIAAINAGFFTPTGEPLGLVLSGKKSSGAWNSASSLGSGIWHQNASGQSAISRRERLGKSAACAMQELIQAGPLLVEGKRPIGGLEPLKSSARSVILWDGGDRWWLGCSAPCTLAALGAALTHASPASWPVDTALNLDGGRSTDLWISAATSGGPVLKRLPWNRPVRNFLVLTER